MVARAYRHSLADPEFDPDRNRRLRPRAVYLQFVLESASRGKVILRVDSVVFAC